MMKLAPKVYRGIEYVVLGDLPEDQQGLLRIAEDIEFIKILFPDGRIIENCIPFRSYTTWYDNMAASHATEDGKSVPAQPGVRISLNGS